MTALRPATLNDADALFDLARRFATSFPVQPEGFARSLDAILSSDAARLLVSVGSSGDIDGYVLAFVHPTFFASGPVAWVEEIRVDVAVGSDRR